MSELTCLEAAAALWLVHLLSQMATAGRAFTMTHLLSSRDTPEPPKGLVWGRATRAFANYVDNLVVFAAVDLGLIVSHHDAGWAPAVWVAARVVYLPLYLCNVIYARTIAAAVAIVSLVVMLGALAGVRPPPNRSASPRPVGRWRR